MLGMRLNPQKAIIKVIRIIIQIPNIKILPGRTGVTAPGLSFFSLINVPFVLSRSVTSNIPSFLSRRACRPDTAQQKKNSWSLLKYKWKNKKLLFVSFLHILAKCQR